MSSKMEEATAPRPSTFEFGDYPNIRRAVLEMEYDNGVIHRFRPEAEALKDAAEVIRQLTISELEMVELNDWLGALTDDEMMTLTGGEESEIAALAAQGPRRGDVRLVDYLLNSVFQGEPAA